jgi:biotin transport system substrate-specific component
MTSANSATLLRALTAPREAEGSGLAIRVASVLFFTALTATAAQISFPLPFTQVPFTFQPTVVLLGGLVLGARLGCASQVLYLMAGLAGLPVFAASATLPPGPLRLLGPTGGYLMAYPLAAFVTGYLAERGFDRRYLTSLLALAAGLAIIYASGAAWLGLFARTITGSAAIGMSAAFATGVYPFLIPDLIKLAAAAGVVPGMWRLIGRRP